MKKIWYSCGLLLVMGCSSDRTASRTGKYVYAVDLKLKGILLTQTWNDQFIELKPDNTYMAKNGKLINSGRYSVTKDKINFTASDGTVYGGYFKNDALELNYPSFGIKLDSSQSSPEDMFIKQKPKS